MGHHLVVISWFINHYSPHENYTYICRKATYKATERYRLGAPSCTNLLPKFLPALSSSEADGKRGTTGNVLLVKIGLGRFGIPSTIICLLLKE